MRNWKKIMLALESGAFTTPKGWDVLMRYPSEQLRLSGKPASVAKPHVSKLYAAFYEKYPLAKLQPLRLNSAQKPLARQFVEQQQKLMASEGLNHQEAFHQTEKLLHQQLHEVARTGQGAGLYLRMAQQEEEKSLQRALRSLYNARHTVAK